MNKLKNCLNRDILKKIDKYKKGSFRYNRDIVKFGTKKRSYKMGLAKESIKEDKSQFGLNFKYRKVIIGVF